MVISKKINPNNGKSTMHSSLHILKTLAGVTSIDTKIQWFMESDLTIKKNISRVSICESRSVNGFIKKNKEALRGYWKRY